MATTAVEALKAELQAKLAAPGVRVDKVWRAETKQVDEKEHTVTNIISSASIDRDMETVLPAAFKRDKGKRFPFVSSHDYSDLRKQIGDLSFKARDDGVEGTMQYLVGKGNPEADWAFTLAQNNMARFSIGFRPVKWEDANLDDEKTVNQILAGKIPLRTYTEIELFEVSQVIVPSNRDAVQNAVSKGVVTADEGKQMIDLLAVFEEKQSEPDIEPESETEELPDLLHVFDYNPTGPVADMLAGVKHQPAPELAPTVTTRMKVAPFGEGGPDEVVVLNAENEEVWRGSPAEMVEVLTLPRQIVVHQHTLTIDEKHLKDLSDEIAVHIHAALQAGKDEIATALKLIPVIPPHVAELPDSQSLAKMIGSAIAAQTLPLKAAITELQKANADPSQYRM